MRGLDYWISTVQPLWVSINLVGRVKPKQTLHPGVALKDATLSTAACQKVTVNYATTVSAELALDKNNTNRSKTSSQLIKVLARIDKDGLPLIDKIEMGRVTKMAPRNTSAGDMVLKGLSHCIQMTEAKCSWNEHEKNEDKLFSKFKWNPGIGANTFKGNKTCLLEANLVKRLPNHCMMNMILIFPASTMKNRLLHQISWMFSLSMRFRWRDQMLASDKTKGGIQFLAWNNEGSLPARNTCWHALTKMVDPADTESWQSN